MDKVFRFTLIVLLLILVITGLNLSNQGINQLTLNNRGPVAGIAVTDGNFTVQTLGQNHTFQLGYFKAGVEAIQKKIIDTAHRISAYLIKLWQIFKALFL